MKYGICAGRFKLLHQAHKEYIIQAISEVDKLYVIIMHSDVDTRFATLPETQQAISKILQNLDFNVEKDYEIIIAPQIDNIDDWEQWLIDNLNIENMDDWVIFNSKSKFENKRFRSKYLDLFSLHMDKLSVSSIEDEIYSKYSSNLICREFMPYINKKIVIAGTESTGKTVLTKKLASIYGTNYSEEYGRYHSRIYLGGQDITMLPRDFVHIAMKQILQDKEENLKSSRFLFVDTDPIITLNFLYRYMDRLKELNLMKNDIEKEVKNAEDFLIETIISYKCDMRLYLMPNVKYVEDGIRWDIDQEQRNIADERLQELYKKFNQPYEIISEESYNLRFKKAVSLINDEFINTSK